MKFLVYVSLCVCIGQAIGATTENYAKTTLKLTNSIPQSQKHENYYHPTAPQQPEYVPAQYIPKQMYVAPQPHAMIIIAQPALMSPNLIYGGGAAPAGMQQLLNYFHSNPQAKYQLLYGGYQPQPSAQTYIAQPSAQTYIAQPSAQSYIAQQPQHQSYIPQPSPSVATYQIVPSAMFNGYNHLVAAPSHVNYNQVPIQYHPNQIHNHQYVQPLHLNQVSHMAHMAAQQYTAPIRSLPPVITGLEHFTPDQQAQIKAQLGAHFGISGTTSTTQSNPSQQQLQPQQPTQSVSEAEKSSKTLQNFTPSQVYRTQYTKGK